MASTAIPQPIVNCLGAPWPEDLSAPFIDQLLAPRRQGGRLHRQSHLG